MPVPYSGCSGVLLSSSFLSNYICILIQNLSVTGITNPLHKKTSLSGTELWEVGKGLEEMNLKEMSFTLLETGSWCSDRGKSSNRNANKRSACYYETNWSTQLKHSG